MRCRLKHLAAPVDVSLNLSRRRGDLWIRVLVYRCIRTAADSYERNRSQNRDGNPDPSARD